MTSKKRKTFLFRRINLAFLFAIILVIQCILSSDVFAQQPEGENKVLPVVSSTSIDQETFVAAPAGVRVNKISNTALKLTWKKVVGASGYRIYKWNAKVKKYRIARMLTGGGKIAWTDGKLKSNVTYKYRVRAFKKVSGKKHFGAYSDTVSARAYTTKAKTVNVGSIQVDYTLRYLGLNGVKKVSASVVVPKGKTALSKMLMWKSSNRSIVKVNQYGWIEAQGKPGKAKIVIRAHNGVTRTLMITVADYAHPEKFTNLNKVKKWNKTAGNILEKYRNELTTITAWLEKFKSKVQFFYEDESLHYDLDTIGYDPIETELTVLLKDTNMQVNLEKGNLDFVIPLEKVNLFGASIIYSDYNGKDNPKEGSIRVAPCWYFYDGRNDLD